jgi:hypothetical protein
VTGGDWGTITDFALCNTLTTGQVLLHAAVDTEMLVEVDDISRFNDGELVITAD